VSPVMQTAETAVKNAVTKSVELPAAVEKGKSKKMVPTITAAPNAMTTIWVGCRVFLRPGWLTVSDYASTAHKLGNLSTLHPS